jgi:hypothetical protein
MREKVYRSKRCWRHIIHVSKRLKESDIFRQLIRDTRTHIDYLEASNVALGDKVIEQMHFTS